MCPVVNDLPPEIRPGDFGAHQQLARVQWSHSASHQRPAAEWDVTLWSHGCQWMARTTRTRQVLEPQTTRRSRKIQKDPESYMVETCCFWLMVMKITQGTTI